MHAHIPSAHGAAMPSPTQAHGNTSNVSSSRTPRSTAMHADSITHGSDKNLHDTAVRIGAEVTTGFASAWTAGSIGQGVGTLIGALVGTLLGPGVGTMAGATLGGAEGELVGVAAGATFGVHLGAEVARDIIA